MDSRRKAARRHPSAAALLSLLAAVTAAGGCVSSEVNEPGLGTPDAGRTVDAPAPPVDVPSFDGGAVDVPATADLAPPPPTDAGTLPQDTGAPPRDGGAATDAFTLIWPNEISAANSDPWLAEHHEEITEMRPRALILNFANGHTAADVMARWNLMSEAFSAGSTYHGYKDPNAKPFVVHELVKMVDLTDRPVPAGWTAPNSTRMPRLNGGIDFAQLYNQTFADAYGFPDPANPARRLNFCELLRKGVVNELFIAFNKTGSDGNVPEIIEYKQRYDANDRKIPGQFDPIAGNGNFEPADLPAARACGITIRVDFIEMTGTLSGAIHVLSHNFEHMGERTIPNYKKFFGPFMNQDFDVRFQAPFRDWYGISVNQAPTNFVTFTGMNAVQWVCPPGSPCAGRTGAFNPFNQGCGSTHYAPNSRNSYDMNNTQVVLTRCEHYGLQDGPDGKDLQTPYSAATVAKLAQKFGNDGNGGGWQIYLFQNLPGHKSGAKMPDGTPIKNFWPYAYY